MKIILSLILIFNLVACGTTTTPISVWTDDEYLLREEEKKKLRKESLHRQSQQRAVKSKAKRSAKSASKRFKREKRIRELHAERKLKWEEKRKQRKNKKAKKRSIYRNDSNQWQQFKPNNSLEELDKDFPEESEIEVVKVTKNENLKRFPTIESPNEVKVGDSVTVLISLTEEQLTPTVKVTQGKTDTEGRLKLSLPKQDNNKDWPIDVVLSASGFTFNSPNKATIYLPKVGDSSPAMFQLSVKNSEVIAAQRRLYATFWYKGQYIARVMKPIIVNQSQQKVSQACSANSILSANSGKMVKQAETAKLDENRSTADLTIYMRRDWDSCANTDYFITLSSPHIETRHERINLPEDINLWLLPKYKMFSQKGRGLSLSSENKNSALADKDQMIGFGKLIYRKFAPISLRETYTELKHKLGKDFKSIQIYTDDPSIPWELMVPDNTNNFIGIKHTVARWIIPKTASDFSVPTQQLNINGVRVVVPEYSGSLKLTATKEEAKFIVKLPWKNSAKMVKANYASLKTELQKEKNILFHYAGHGYTERANNGRITDYGLILEDAKLRSLNWRGMLGDQVNSSFVFFNACEVGQSEKAAGFVDGWSSTLTDTGSSGFISGLWKLGDQGAAEFSRRFYQNIETQLQKEGRASVALAMRVAREAFLEKGNPTYLAYVFYGDVALMLKEQKH